MEIGLSLPAHGLGDLDKEDWFRATHARTRAGAAAAALRRRGRSGSLAAAKTANLQGDSPCPRSKNASSA